MKSNKSIIVNIVNMIVVFLITKRKVECLLSEIRLLVRCSRRVGEEFWGSAVYQPD